MKIHQIFNFGFKKVSSSNSQNNDLTSFGETKEVKQNQSTELISKDAAYALKNKYMSNVSFAGHMEEMHINTDEGERVTKYRCGTRGIYDEPRNLDGHGVYPVEVYVGPVKTYAKIDSGSTQMIDGRNASILALDTIRNCASCDYNDRIKEIYSASSSHSGSSVRKVYFTDPGETVYASDRAGADYVVYKRGAHDADERSFWEKLWG